MIGPFLTLFNKTACLLIIVLCLCSSCVAEENKIVEKLVFPSAYEIVNGYDDRLKATAVAYKVQLEYPSKKVLEFCNKRLKELGWQKEIFYPINNEKEKNWIGERNWIDFIDGTKENEPLVHQLYAYWSNTDKSRMVTLGLRYYSYGLTRKEKLKAIEPNTDIVTVIVQIGPYVDLSKTPKGENESPEN